MKIGRKQIANMHFDLYVGENFEKLCIYSYNTKIIQIRADYDDLDIEVDSNYYSSSSTRHLGIALAIAKCANFEEILLEDIFSIIYNSKSLKDLVNFFGYVHKEEKVKLFKDNTFLYIY